MKIQNKYFLLATYLIASSFPFISTASAYDNEIGNCEWKVGERKVQQKMTRSQCRAKSPSNFYPTPQE